MLDHLNEEVLLHHTLVTEPDVQCFIDLVLQSVERLNGNRFIASAALLSLLPELRLEADGQGCPVPVDLLLQQQNLCIRWGEHCHMLVRLAVLPARRDLKLLKSYLQDSVEAQDPLILLLRNREMKLYFEQEQQKAKRDFDELQLSLQQRQRELEDATLRAETDGLTGLYNRSSFDLRIKQAFLHTMRQRNSSLSLVLLDLDYFKQINDEYGHQYGDRHLIKMARALNDIIRENVDMAFRFGGDEFAALIFADSALASLKAQQVLAVMDNKVSVGITEINADTEADLVLEDFIRRADDALYSAKRKGRGQVVVA